MWGHSSRHPAGNRGMWSAPRERCRVRRAKGTRGPRRTCSKTAGRFPSRLAASVAHSAHTMRMGCASGASRSAARSPGDPSEAQHSVSVRSGVGVRVCPGPLSGGRRPPSDSQGGRAFSRVRLWYVPFLVTPSDALESSPRGTHHGRAGPPPTPGPLEPADSTLLGPFPWLCPRGHSCGTGHLASELLQRAPATGHGTTGPEASR